MAASILASISKILLQKGIEALLGIALQGIGAGAGVNTGAVPSGSTEILMGSSAAAIPHQHGGLVRGLRTAAPDSVLARLTPGEFVLRRDIVDKVGVQALERFNRGQTRLPAFQQGGPVMPAMAMPSIPATGMMTSQSRQGSPQAAPQIYNVIVRDDMAAERKAAELKQMEGAIVNVIYRQITGGDGTPVNRALQMVHGSRR
jgi:hypothetical protein